MIQEIKYYGTIGPASMEKPILKALVKEGMTGIRINLSHVNLWEMEETINRYQEILSQGISSDAKVHKADILIDLQGPELRIGEIENEHFLFLEDIVHLVVAANTNEEKTIPLSKEIIDQMKPGVIFIVDDGKLKFQVMASQTLQAKVIRPGVLMSRKSILLENINIETATLTPKDIENLKVAMEYGVTGVMLPFVRGKEDVLVLREALHLVNGKEIRILAKIENEIGVLKLEEIATYADEIIIARGDLGNAVSLPELPIIQEKIADICKKMNVPFMVVTQLLDSMESQQVPTRAEVTDIFHAIAQGASSLMLTGETAKGSYPVEAMQVLVETGNRANQYIYSKSR